VDDKPYDKAPLCAAEWKSTVSGLVKPVAHEVSEDLEFDHSRHEEDEMRRRLHRAGVVFSAAERRSRDALHERNVVR
jgi:hypothetical protein